MKKIMLLMSFGDVEFSKNEWEKHTGDFSKKKKKSLILYDMKKKRYFGFLYPNKKSKKNGEKSVLKNNILHGYKVRKINKDDIL